MSRYARKADRNQAAMVRVLRHYGLRVAHTHTIGAGFPDLLVSGQRRNDAFEPANLLVEVKARGGSLTPSERAWLEEWAGPVMVARHPSDVLDWFGATTEQQQLADAAYTTELSGATS